MHELNKMLKELKLKLKAAVEDSIIDRQENTDILSKIKEIEVCIMNDGIITFKEEKLMKEAQALFDKYMTMARLRLNK